MAKAKKEPKPVRASNALEIECIDPGNRDLGIMPVYRANGGGAELIVSLPHAIKIKFDAPDERVAIAAYNKVCGVIGTSETHKVESPEDLEDSDTGEDSE
jgi:phage tail protein X